MSDTDNESDVEKKQFITSEDEDSTSDKYNPLQKLLRLQIAPACIRARYVLVIIGFIGLSIDYALRINLSMAIINMVSFSILNNYNTRVQCALSI